MMMIVVEIENMPKQNQKAILSFATDMAMAEKIEKQAHKLNMSVSKFVRDIVVNVVNDSEDDEA